MIFLGLLFNKEDEEIILSKSTYGIQNQVNKFQWSILNGIFNYANVNIISALPVATFPKYSDLVLNSKTWLTSHNVEVTEIGSVNLPFIKQVMRYLKVKKAIKSISMNSQFDGEIMIYSTYLPYILAAIHQKKNAKTTLIVTDLPEYYDFSHTNFIFKFFRRMNNLLLHKSMKRIDRFIFLTEHMRYAIEIKDKPYLVVEGSIDNVMTSMDPNNVLIDDKKVVFYAGSLNKPFGIIELLDAFSLIEDASYELWLCGKGDTESLIKKKAKDDQRIKYFGYLSTKELKKIQNKATVLINPRKNIEEYTKYSFPSKTLEYLATGKPTIMYRLDGVPPEYEHFLNYVEDNTIEALRDCILKVCSQSKTEMTKKGNETLKWLVKEKSSDRQGKKIVDFINRTK